MPADKEGLSYLVMNIMHITSDGMEFQYEAMLNRYEDPWQCHMRWERHSSLADASKPRLYEFYAQDNNECTFAISGTVFRW